jgi:hypothetical protein
MVSMAGCWELMGSGTPRLADLSGRRLRRLELRRGLTSSRRPPKAILPRSGCRTHIRKGAAIPGMIAPVDHIPIKNHSVNVIQVSDVLQRVFVHDDDIGQLSCFHGT